MISRQTELGNSVCRVFDPLMKSIRVKTANFAETKSGDRALDVCCGAGAQVIQYAKMGAIASGIDLDPNMIRAAVKKSDKHGLDNTYFKTASALDLPFEDNYFDYASICLALHEKGRGQRNIIISEMKRVVKKEEGFLVLVDYQVPQHRTPFGLMIRMIEFLAGKVHYGRFKDYIACGGLDNLLEVNGLVEEKRVSLNPIEIIKARNKVGS